MNAPSTYKAGVLPPSARYCGWAFLAGQTLVVGRIVFESSILTCANGPQAVGFSLFHLGGPRLLIFLAGLCFVPLAFVWLVATVTIGLIKKLKFSGLEWLLILAFLVEFALFFVPYPYWEHFDVVVCGAGSHGDEFLQDAAFNGDMRLVRVLLAEGYDVNHESDDGVTPISAAIAGKKVGVVALLLSKGANVNAHTGLSGGTPLMAAAETGDVSIVKFLLAHGADPCATSRQGENALSIARRGKRQEIVEHLSTKFQCPMPTPVPLSCDQESTSTCVVVH